VGAQTTQNNVDNIRAWMSNENPTSNWNNRNNPLNASLGTSAADGTASYSSLDVAATYTAKMINQSNMSAIKAALMANANRTDFANAVISSPWASSHYDHNVGRFTGASLARGTQLIARNQLAMLHRGEAVIPAADNYSTAPYNKNGAVGGNNTAVHLNFKAGSVILQVPPNASQKDMENIANQFAQAIAKPQLLASARSQ
jgi:hypothetical protein